MSLHVTPYSQWINPFRAKAFNWIDFDFIHLSVEYGRYKGTYFEIDMRLLGLGLCVEWIDDTTQSVFMADMDQRMAEARDYFDSESP